MALPNPMTSSTALPHRSKRRERWLFVVLPYFSLFCLLVLVSFFFGLFVTGLGMQWGTFTCLPNGSVHFPWQNTNNQTPSTWDASMFLLITIGFGKLTFAQAKAIDICWDLVVGRGGQALLIWLCYPFFRRAFTRVMESRAVTFPVFAAVAFDKVGLSSMAKLGSSIAGRRSHRPAQSRTVGGDWPLLLLTLAFAYLLAFPTFLSAITGYQNRMIPYVTSPTDNATLLRMSDWWTPEYVIEDGSRMGLQDDFPVFIHDPPVAGDDMDYTNATELYRVFVDCYLASLNWSYDGSHNLHYWIPPKLSNFTAQDNYTYAPSNRCSFTLSRNSTNRYQNLSSSVTLYGKRYDISPPVLQITPNVLGSNKVEGATYFALGNVTLTRPYLRANSLCEPATTYQWGFASIPSFIFCVLTVLFAAVLVALQQEVFWNGRVSRHEASQATDTFRDVLDLSEEMRTQYGERVQGMSVRELKELVGRERGSMSVDTEGLLPSRKQVRKEAAHHSRVFSSKQGRTAAGLPRWRRGRDVAPASSTAKQALIVEDDIKLQAARSK